MLTQKSFPYDDRFYQLTHYEMNKIKGGDEPTPPQPPPVGSGGGDNGDH